MSKQPHRILEIKRRALVLGLGWAGLAAQTALGQTALGQSAGVLNAAELGLQADNNKDQSQVFQLLLDRAAASGRALALPAGTFRVSGVKLASNLTLFGVRGATVLKPARSGPILGAERVSNLKIDNISIDGGAGNDNLVEMSQCTNLALEELNIRNGAGNAIYLDQCQGRVGNCAISGVGQTGIHLQNSAGMMVFQNRIANCANGGVRVWRDNNGYDGTIVSNNQISNIGSGSGNGQNGNGVNIFKADAVIVANNAITGCAFSAVRANSTNNTIIEANQCTNSLEVAIFSEFAFSGSMISNNIVDGAAGGISVTNFNDGGSLAVCANNIVRNIAPFSPTNPDTRPVGIFVEADVAVSGNVVDNVPGTGIAAGWGPYLRNVLVANNVVRQTQIGIAVSVAEGAGLAKINANLISGAKTAALAGTAWTDIISLDLVADAERFSNVSLSNNSVIRDN